MKRGILIKSSADLRLQGCNRRADVTIVASGGYGNCRELAEFGAVPFRDVVFAFGQCPGAQTIHPQITLNFDCKLLYTRAIRFVSGDVYGSLGPL